MKIYHTPRGGESTKHRSPLAMEALPSLLKDSGGRCFVDASLCQRSSSRHQRRTGRARGSSRGLIEEGLCGESLSKTKGH